LKLAGQRVAICGGGGFIGGHLAKRLLAQNVKSLRCVDLKPLAEWHQVSPSVENLRLDLRLKEGCESAVRDADVVFNLAADMGGMGFIENNKALCMLSVLINTHLLLAARNACVQRYFFASSACVYNSAKQADPNVTALREEDAYPAQPEDGYGWEKLFGERMCRHFAEDFGLDCRIARHHNVYGPWGTFDGGREKAPAAVCRKALQAKLTGQHEIEIWGDGRQTRSFLYIDDCLEGTQRLMESDVAEPLNIGSGELVSINQLVDIAEEIAGVKLKRTYNLNAPKGVNGRNSDNTKTKHLLGWEPAVRLRDGLARTYQWIETQMEAKACANAAAPAHQSAEATS